MSDKNITSFQASFLHPKYWGIWLVVALWRIILLLPYPILLHIGNGLGWLFSRLKVGKRRAKIARRNLQLCFPQYSEEQIEQLLQANLKATGMAIIETGMAWFWSDRRIKKWSKIEGLENLTRHTKEGVLLVGVHFLTLELGARIVGIHQAGIGVYRPNDNPLLDWIQKQGRLRSNKGLLDRKDMRGMVRALRSGKIIWYAPDHDYGRRNSVFVPFFAVPDAATTTGSHFLLKSSPTSKVVPFAPLRNADGSGYTVIISPAVDFSSFQDEVAVATKMNQVIEEEINKGIEQYMWLHRRFKTRPESDPESLYE